MSRTWRFTDEDEIRKSHDYVIDFARKNPDVVYGNWVAINPSMKGFWLKEFRRLAGIASAGSLVFAKSQNSAAFSPQQLGVENRSTSCRLMIGAPGAHHDRLDRNRAGTARRQRHNFEEGHPRHVDIVAARFPDLKILAGRPAWPWQDDMLAVLLHKSNVQYEVHG